MAGYIPFETLRPILHRGPVPMPVVDIDLVRPSPALTKASRTPFRLVGKMRKLRATGLSYRKIATTFHCDPETVRKYTRDVALPEGHWSPGRRERRPLNKEFAERLRRSGFSYAEIAVNIGCVESAAYYLLNGRQTRISGRRVKLHRLVHAVSRVTGIPCQDLRRDPIGPGVRADPATAKARHILFWVAYSRLGMRGDRLDGMSLPVLGKSLGGFDHTTIGYGVKRVEKIISEHRVPVVGGAITLARRLWQMDWSEVPR